MNETLLNYPDLGMGLLYFIGPIVLVTGQTRGIHAVQQLTISPESRNGTAEFMELEED